MEQLVEGLPPPAPDRTPLPKPPPGTPRTDSTVRLLEQTRAIRTPQPIEPAKIQVCARQRR